jgi:hypothetical protein
MDSAVYNGNPKNAKENDVFGAVIFQMHQIECGLINWNKI